MNISKELKSIDDKRMAAENELKEIERLIFKLESDYLRDTANEGNVIRGWESLISQKASKQSMYLARKQGIKSFPDKERIFSLSSVTHSLKPTEDEFSDNVLPMKRKAPTSSKNSSLKRKSKRRLDDEDYSDDIIG